MFFYFWSTMNANQYQRNTIIYFHPWLINASNAYISLCCFYFWPCILNVLTKCRDSADIFSNATQQTFQRCFNVVFWLIRRCDVGERHINVETTFYISTLGFTTSNNVESILCTSTLIWTTLDNVKTTLSFLMSSFTTLVNVETTLWKWPFLKRTIQIISNRIYRIQSFNYYFTIFFTLLPMLKEICLRTFARLRNFIKNHERYYIARI